LNPAASLVIVEVAPTEGGKVLLEDRKSLIECTSY